MNLSIPVTISSIHERFLVTVNTPTTTQTHEFKNYPDPTTITINLTVSTTPFSANITVKDLIDSETTTERLIYLSPPAPEPTVTFSAFIDPIQPLPGDSNELDSSFLDFAALTFDPKLMAEGAYSALSSFIDPSQMLSLGFGIFGMIILAVFFGTFVASNPLLHFALLTALPFIIDFSPLIQAFRETDKEKKKELIRLFWKDKTLELILTYIFGFLPLLGRKAGVLLSESSDYFKSVAGNFNPEDIASFRKKLQSICDWCDNLMSKNNVAPPKTEMFEKELPNVVKRLKRTITTAKVLPVIVTGRIKNTRNVSSLLGYSMPKATITPTTAAGIQPNVIVPVKLTINQITEAVKPLKR